MFGPHSLAMKMWNNNTRGCPFSQWPLLPCYLQIGTIHCWLPQASLAFWDHPKLLPKVSHIILIVKILKFTRCRYTARPENLDNPTAHTALIRKLTLLSSVSIPTSSGVSLVSEVTLW
jgi:hypothetical protein